MSEQNDTASPPFVLFAALAIAVGLYARFKGLGFAPIGVDEYYLSRAVDNILKFGYPGYDCGGLYQRGIGLQYLIASLRLAGLSPEMAPRLVAAVASLFTLPAVYLIARRLLSINGALLAVGIVALSLWEVEMSRFGRFYAPFQAIFCWYLVYFLKFTVDRNAQAWKGMLILTAVATLVWEGAIFLALANFVPLLIALSDRDRIHRSEWLSAAVSVPLLIGTFFLGTFYFGQFLETAQHPDGYSPEVLSEPVSKLDIVSLAPASGMAHGPALLAVGLLLIASAFALRWIWQWRERPVAALGLLVILGAAWTHEFAVIIAVGLLLALLKQLPLADTRWRGAGVYAGTVVAVAASWIVYNYLHLDWSALVAQSGSAPKALAIFLYQFIRFPGVLVEIVRPFAATVPWLSALLALAIGTLVVRQIKAAEFRSAERVLLVILLLLALGIGLSGPPRHETRYSYFLYPLLVLLALASVSHLVSILRLRDRTGDLATAAIVLVLFVATEDFSVRHLIAVDSPESTYRVGATPEMEAHLGEARADFRLVAKWLNARTTSGQDLVVNAVHGLDYYYSGTNYFYTEYNGSNFRMWSCRKGSVDRWTNHPLIYTLEDLKAKTAGARATYLVTWTEGAEDLLPLLADRGAVLALTEGFVTVIALKSAPN